MWQKVGKADTISAKNKHTWLCQSEGTENSQRFCHIQGREHHAPGILSLLLQHLLPSCLLNCAQGLGFIWWLQFYSDLLSIDGNLKYEKMLMPYLAGQNESSECWLKAMQWKPLFTFMSPYDPGAQAKPQRQTPLTTLKYSFENFPYTDSWIKMERIKQTDRSICYTLLCTWICFT